MASTPPPLPKPVDTSKSRLLRSDDVEEPMSAPAATYAPSGVSAASGSSSNPLDRLMPTRRRVQSVQSRRPAPHLGDLPPQMTGSAAVVGAKETKNVRSSGRLQPAGSRWRRRTASLPDARPALLESTTTGTGSALKALAVLRQLKTSADDAEGKAVNVSGKQIASLLQLVQNAASVVADSRSVEMVMKYKFLTLPDVYDPELQRYLLSSYTPRQTNAGAGASPAVAPGSPEMSAAGGVPPCGIESGSGYGSGSGMGLGIASPPTLPVVPSPEVSAALEDVGTWSFDVFALEEMAPGESLRLVGMKLATECDFLTRFHIPEAVMQSYLARIQTAYLADNPYHNSLHGADIGSSLYHFVKFGGMKSWMSEVQVFASLLGALVHDVGHIAVNNAFLVATHHPLALTYNDNSPLENMHIAKAFELSRLPGCNVFGGLDGDDYKVVRKSMVELVLSTDNALHFSLLGSLTQAMSVQSADDPPLTSTPKGQSLVLQIGLHAADVSNPAKAWSLYLRWTSRLIDEFYSQGDKERTLGIPVTPMLDRSKPIPLPKFQAGFINAIVLPLYKELARVPGMTIDPVVTQLESNLEEWNRRIEIMNASSHVPPPAVPTTASAPSTPKPKS